MNNLFLYYILLINFIGLCLMYIDKSKAIRNQWRISESKLLLVSIVGGNIGSLLGMNLFRHKTKHPKFTIGIPIIIIIQLLILHYLPSFIAI